MIWLKLLKQALNWNSSHQLRFNHLKQLKLSNLTPVKIVLPSPVHGPQSTLREEGATAARGSLRALQAELFKKGRSYLYTLYSGSLCSLADVMPTRVTPLLPRGSWELSARFRYRDLYIYRSMCSADSNTADDVTSEAETSLQNSFGRNSATF